MSLIDNFSIRIYESPISEIRDSDFFPDVANPVHVLILLVDFVTEMEINGINDFIGNSPGRFAHKTVAALRAVGQPALADTLMEIIRIASEAGMTHESIQDDLRGLPEFSIISFSDIHGDKWDDACESIQDLADGLDIEAVYSCMNEYCDRHHAEIVSALNNND
jgi:hypothetical protein